VLKIVLASLGPLFVGAVFLLAAAAKAADPKGFARQLKKYGLLPRPLLVPLALGFTALQFGLGTALLLRVEWRWLVPAAALLLLLLAVLTLWGIVTKRIEDCGCYNGLLAITAWQSLMLDGIYLGLLALAWSFGEVAGALAPWKLYGVLAAAALGGVGAFASLSYSTRHHRPPFNLSPLKVGRRWNPLWLGNSIDLSIGSGTTIVVFLSSECPQCHRWVQLLNLAHRLAELPTVAGVVEHRPGAEQPKSKPPGFPTVKVEPRVMSRLLRGATPTALVLEEGVVRDKWVGAMPRAFTDLVQSAMLRSFSRPPGVEAQPASGVSTPGLAG
jgi:hypothetical protein